MNWIVTWRPGRLVTASQTMPTHEDSMENLNSKMFGDKKYPYLEDHPI